MTRNFSCLFLILVTVLVAVACNKTSSVSPTPTDPGQPELNFISFFPEPGSVLHEGDEYRFKYRFNRTSVGLVYIREDSIAYMPACITSSGGGGEDLVKKLGRPGDMIYHWAKGHTIVKVFVIRADAGCVFTAIDQKGTVILWDRVTSWIELSLNWVIV